MEEGKRVLEGGDRIKEKLKPNSENIFILKPLGKNIPIARNTPIQYRSIRQRKGFCRCHPCSSGRSIKVAQQSFRGASDG